MMKNKRLEYVDMLRGFAILLVVMGHTLEFNGYQNSPLYDLIYSFHMPLFFCISGFVTMYACKLVRETKAVDYGTYVCHKFLAIMLPYLVWSLVVDPFFFAHSFDVEKLRYAFRATLIDNGSYWFLPCLFNLLAIFTFWIFVTNRLKKKSVMVDSTLLVVLWGGVIRVSSIDYMRSVSSYFLPFFLGVMMGRYGKMKALVVDNKVVFSVCLVSYCLVAGYFGASGGLMNKVIRLVAGILAVPILFHFFVHTTFHKTLAQGMAIVGRYTLVIYVMHYRAAFIAATPIPANMGLWSQMTVFFVIAVLISYTIVLAAKVVEKSPFLSMCMLGKRIKTDVSAGSGSPEP